MAKDLQSRILREFAEWLRARDVVEIEDLNADGDDVIVRVPTKPLVRLLADLTPAQFEKMVAQEAVDAPVQEITDDSLAVPSGHDYETWTESVRRKANLAALRALMRYSQRGGDALDDTEREALRAFSGWGGIKVRKLPEDPQVWPPDYLEALRDWREAISENRPPKFTLFRGIKQQFFTPVAVTRFMLDLAVQAARRPIRTILEPSAGVGRFVGSALGEFELPDYEWNTPALDEVSITAVELDPLLQRIFHALYPEAHLAKCAFEVFGRAADEMDLTNRGLFDMVISNPPYPIRSSLYLAAHGEEYRRAAAYFTWATVRMLAPGGVLCTLVPMGQMTSRDPEAVALRRFLMRMAEPMAVVPLPADVFPGALVQTVVHCWVRRETPLSQDELKRLLAAEPSMRAIVDGNSVRPVLGESTVFGTWGPSQRYPGDFELQSNGAPFDVRAIDFLSDPPVSVWRSPADREDWIEALVAKADGKDVFDTGPQVHKPVAATGTALHDALDLDARLSTFLRARMEDPERAALTRPELLADVTSFIQRHGNPHVHQDLLGNRRTIATFLAAITPEGAPGDVLKFDVKRRVVEGPPMGSTLDQVVDYYCEVQGGCPESKLDAYGFTAPLSELPEHLYLTIDAGGDATIYNEDTYLSGNLHLRNDNIEAVLAGSPQAWLVKRMQAQQRKVTEHLGWKSLAEISLTPSSGFLVLEDHKDPYVILNEFIAHSLRSIGAASDPPPRVQLYDENRRFKIRRDGDWGGPSFEITNKRHVPRRWEWTLKLVGYLNNDLQIEDIDNGETKETKTDRYDTTDFDLRKAQDRELEERFAAWLASSRWVDVVEKRYNRAFGGFIPGKLSTKPLTITRWSPKIKPDEHQTQLARWIGAQGSGIAAFAVGVGKTFSALLTLANERQAGRVHRPLFVVPNNLIGNWYAEAKKALPDYSICVIGYTWDAENEQLRVLPKADRAVQWQRVAMGEYELTLASYSTFLRDVELSDEETRRVLSDLVWLRAGAQVNRERQAFLERKIAEAQKEITALEAAIAKLEAEKVDPRTQQGRLVNIDSTLGKYQETLAKAIQERDKRQAEYKLTEGVSETDLATMSENLEALIALKPFRPRGAPDLPWRPTDGILDLRSRLRSVLVEAGGGSLKAGAAKLLDLDGADPEEWIASARKFEVVEALSEVDPIEHEATYSLDETGKAQKKKQPPVPALILWESLGIDFLVVDEAHNFKNLFYPKRNPQGATTVKYMGVAGGITGRAWDLWSKAQYLLRRNQDRGVLLLTATPEKNSPLEVYNLIHLVSTTCWPSRGIQTPEAFVRRYLGIEANVMVPTKTGDGVEEATAVSEWLNVDELREVRERYMMRRTVADIPALAAKVPKARIERVEFELDERQYALYEAASKAISAVQEEAIENGEEPDPSLALRLLGLLGKVNLDPRYLVEDWNRLEAAHVRNAKRLQAYEEWVAKGRKGKAPPAPQTGKEETSDEVGHSILVMMAKLLIGADPTDDVEPPPLPDLLKKAFPRTWVSPKIQEVVETVQSIGTECGHVIFCDYTKAIKDIQRALIAAGIPKDRIGIMAGGEKTREGSEDSESAALARYELSLAFNGEWQKDATGRYVEVRKPEVDILIGTTFIMGEGMNLQTRTCALHHVTLPWEPASVEQRNGRAVRQGNVYVQDPDFAVRLVFYLAKYTTDAARLDMITAKKELQDALNDTASNRISNPAISIERLRQMLQLSLRDPQMAIQMMERQQAKMDARRRRLRFDALKQRLKALHGTAVRARGQSDTRLRAAEARLYGEMAAQAVRQFSDLVPNIEAIVESILQAPTYAFLQSGAIFRQGARVRASIQVGDRTFNQDEPMELITVDPNGSFSVRLFGELAVHRVWEITDFIPDVTVRQAARKDPSLMSIDVIEVPWDTAKDQQEAVGKLSLEDWMKADYDTEMYWRRKVGMGAILRGAMTAAFSYRYDPTVGEIMGGLNVGFNKGPPMMLVDETDQSAYVLGPVRSAQIAAANQQRFSKDDTAIFNGFLDRFTARFRTPEARDIPMLAQALAEGNVYICDSNSTQAPPVPSLLPLRIRPLDPMSKGEEKLFRDSFAKWAGGGFFSAAAMKQVRDAIRRSRGEAPSSAAEAGGAFADPYGAPESTPFNQWK